jgi:hypothetical protein
MVPDDFDPEEVQRQDVEVVRFSYHAPKAGQPAKYEQLRAKAKEFALLLCELTPFSEEQAIAITKLEESVMWANAAIARREEGE